jgi:hypothetical protein
MVPGLGPLLVLAVVGWPDSITVLTVEPGLGGKPSTPTCGWPCATISAASTPSGPEAVAGGAYGRMIFNTTFGDPVPDGARALHLYAVPVKSVFTHSAPTRCRRMSLSPDRAGAVPA